MSENGALPEFAALFAAELPAKRYNFLIDGEPSYVELRPMNQSKMTQWMSMGTKMVRTAGGELSQEADLSGTERRMMFLVANTVTDYCFRQRKPILNSPGDFQAEETRPPMKGRALAHHIETAFVDLTPEFFDFLLNRCLEVNGLGEPAEGNSPDASSN